MASAPGTDAQTPCINTAITPIVYSVGSSSSGPTRYRIARELLLLLMEYCSLSAERQLLQAIMRIPLLQPEPVILQAASGTIKVQSQTIALTSASGAPVCINASLPNIVYTLGGTATAATATGLPPGITGTVTAGNTFTINGTPTVAGISIIQLLPPEPVPRLQ